MSYQARDYPQDYNGLIHTNLGFRLTGHRHEPFNTGKISCCKAEVSMVFSVARQIKKDIRERASVTEQE